MVNDETTVCEREPESRQDSRTSIPTRADSSVRAPGTPLAPNRRILLVDDNTAIHDDFRKILTNGFRPQPGFEAAEAALFGRPEPRGEALNFELESAHQGQEALEKVKQALADDRPYAMAFVDVRMPPGWDGIETVGHLWKAQPELQVVICTAFSDYSWEGMARKLGSPDNLVLLKKPFDNVEVLQLAHAFTRKWELNRQAQLKLEELAEMVARRTCELEKAIANLQREAAERAQAERQFRQAQKMEAVGQLAAGVAHDFNNILTVVHGHASMLSMRLGKTGPHAKSVVEIRHSTERAANLVRQLLMFSRKQVMQFRNVDLGEVIRSISGMLRQLIGEHITLETSSSVGLPPVCADRGMVEQVLVNLTINARDAMPRGGQVTVRAEARDFNPADVKDKPDARPGQYVCLSVADTGSGLDAETMAHLFEPFFTTKEIGKGTGLGLATVYGIVKQHQGWIEVQTEVNVGACFRIFLPVSTRWQPRAVDALPTSAERSGTETILVAEDETSLREIVADVLTLRGYRVLTAESGPAALEMLRNKCQPVDLLLTDMVMPGGMLGTDLAAELKRTNPALKIIYTTGYSPGSTGIQNALDHGVGFLAKPYSPSRLTELVRDCLDGTAER
jgi:signal transduction histidine kinase